MNKAEKLLKRINSMGGVACGIRCGHPIFEEIEEYLSREPEKIPSKYCECGGRILHIYRNGILVHTKTKCGDCGKPIFDLTNPDKVPLKDCPEWVKDEYYEVRFDENSEKKVQFFRSGDGKWDDTSYFHPCSKPEWIERNAGLAYRIPPEPEYTPWTAKDVPPVCWIQDKGEAVEDPEYYLITDITGECVTCSDTDFTYAELFEEKEYSTDLKTWKPCRKEK